jgi:hypothetical protein
MIRMIIALVMATLVFSGVAGEYHPDTLRKFNHQIGIAVSDAGGEGFSYRHWFENRYGLQVSILHVSGRDYYINSSGGEGVVSGSTAFWSNHIGFLGLYQINSWGHHLRALVCMGAAYASLGDIDNRDITVDSTRYRYIPAGGLDYAKVDESVNFDSGIGFELFLWRFSFTLMPGIRYGYSFSEKKYLSPCSSVEAGLFFAW